ncbi:MAG TPA: GtrA family protein [Casimicrobiaceae bacterium]|nr:GtrA family protein [Casimicrobiaceae bacterium]
MQFIRFLFVGVLNALVGYGVFAVLVLLGLNPMPAMIAAYVVGVPFNFLTTGSLVFDIVEWRRFPSFVLAYVVTYFFNVGCYTLLAHTDWPPLAIQGACLPIVAVFSFVLFRFRVFPRSSA